MYSGSIPADTNVVDLIQKDLKDEGLNVKNPLRWIGFEGPAGTTFILNNQKKTMSIPQCGSFVTPFDGETFMPIYSLKFTSSFSNNIYYII